MLYYHKINGKNEKLKANLAEIMETLIQAGLPGFARDSKLHLFSAHDISHNVGPTQNYIPRGRLK